MADATTQDTAAVETSDDSTNTEAAATEAETTETTTVDGEADLRDAGKKALDAMKARVKEAEAKARTESEARAALEAKIAGKEAEFTAQQEAQRVRDEALALANTRIVGAELRAAAKGKVTDEALADLSLYIKPSDFEVGSDGEVDGAAISAAIDDLLARKPYLAAQGKRFQGTADGGARNDAAQPSQLTRADLARMSPEAIDQAFREGRTSDLLSGK